MNIARPQEFSGVTHVPAFYSNAEGSFLLTGLRCATDTLVLGGYGQSLDDVLNFSAPGRDLWVCGNILGGDFDGFLFVSLG